MRIINGRVNHLVNPVGYQLPHLSFSWVTEEAQGKKQSAAQIVIYADPECQEVLYDTGKREDISSLSCNIDLEIKPRTRYYWKVRIFSDLRESAESDVNYFETGLMDEPWKGLWVGCDDSEKRHPVFHKTIAPEGIQQGKKIARARLYICGLGLYAAFIDGQRVGDEFLTPYCNNYDRWIQYQTYDVTQMLGGDKDACPELSVILGNGWYKGRFRYDSKVGDGPNYGDSWRLIAQLVITYGDGTQESIGTDGTWKVTRSNITFSNIYDGEHRDDTLPETEPVPALVIGTADELKDQLPLA